MAHLLERARRFFRHTRDGSRRYIHDVSQPLTLLVLTACFMGTYFSLQTPNSPDGPFFCNADGNVERQGLDYEPIWDPKLFFTVNITYGRVSFATVRILDACWDAIVGRGGQMLAALLSYRVLRRSFKLVLEKNDVPVTTVTPFYCQQIQITSVWQLLRTLGTRQRKGHSFSPSFTARGRFRLAAHVFVCLYVLAFATIVSVTTGYRPEFTGVFDYSEGDASQLKPTNKVYTSQLILYDGSRIGLSDQTMGFERQPFEYKADNSVYRIDIPATLSTSSSFPEPYGTLFDYYFTCLAVVTWATSPRIFDLPANETLSLACADHECSCSLPLPFDDEYDTISNASDFNRYDGLSSVSAQAYAITMLLQKMTSNITLDGKNWELPAPPLTMTLAESPRQAFRVIDTLRGLNASSYWDGSQLYLAPWAPPNLLNNRKWTENGFEPYAYDGLILNEGFVKRTGRCLADDAYSWGFSSLLLLSFCSYTLLFAIVLVLLQTDVYWNSRHDREYQSYSIYKDVLFLSSELKAAFGGNVDDHPAKALDKIVEGSKDGVRLEVDGLPVSRIEQKRISRRAKAAGRNDVDTDPDQELPDLRFEESTRLEVVKTADSDSKFESSSLTESNESKQA